MPTSSYLLIEMTQYFKGFYIVSESSLSLEHTDKSDENKRIYESSPHCMDMKLNYECESASRLMYRQDQHCLL